MVYHPYSADAYKHKIYWRFSKFRVPGNVIRFQPLPPIFAVRALSMIVKRDLTDRFLKALKPAAPGKRDLGWPKPGSADRVVRSGEPRVAKPGAKKPGAAKQDGDGGSI